MDCCLGHGERLPEFWAETGKVKALPLLDDIGYNETMSTLRATLDLLLELQKVDSERDRLIRLRKNLETGDAATAAARQAQEAAAAVHTEHQHTAASLKDAELELAGLEKKIKTFEDRVRSGSIHNSKELMNIEKEIAQLVRLRSALDEKILSLMDDVESLHVNVKLADEQANELDQRRSAAMDTINAERSRLENAIGENNSKRAELAGMVEDDALLKRYEIIRARTNTAGIAIGRVKDNICGACHMQVSSIDANRALAGEVLVICEICGRIMA